MKKIISTAIFAIALAFSVSVSAQAHDFSMNLRVGMRNADVRALQEYLAEAGFFNVNATGYFGSITKRAVIAFQLANDLPGTGFVGTLTRGVLNQGVTVGNNNNNTGSCPVGWSCTPPAGFSCPVGWSCTAPAGNNNNLVGSEGFAEVRLASSPTNNSNVQTNSNVDVYGIEFRAKQSDIMVERINLEVGVSLSGSPENPSTLINTIMIKDGSTVIATIPVNSSTFSRDTSVTPNKYYVQIAGLGVKVSKDTLKTLTVSFNTNSIDSDRVVTVNVYGTSGIRTVDGRGISSYNALADIRTHTFKKPGTSNVTATADATTIYSKNYAVSRTNNGAQNVLMSTFAIKSDTGTSKITSVSVLVASSTFTSTYPATIHLVAPGGQVISKTLPTATTSTGVYVTFDLASDNITVDADMTKTFTIKADLPADTATGTVIRTTVTGVTYEKPNGSTVTLPVTIAGPYHYFAPIVVDFGFNSSTLEVINGVNNAPAGLQATFKGTVTARGGSASTTILAAISLVNISTNAIATTSTTTGQITGNPSMFSDGAPYNIEFTKAFASSGGLIPSGATYKAVISNVVWVPLDNNGASGTGVNQQAGFELMNTSARTY